MLEQEARDILKKALANLLVKYPNLTKYINKYISKHPDKDKALSIVVKKMIELDQYAEWLFREEINFDSSDNG